MHSCVVGRRVTNTKSRCVFQNDRNSTLWSIKLTTTVNIQQTRWSEQRLASIVQLRPDCATESACSRYTCTRLQTSINSFVEPVYSNGGSQTSPNSSWSTNIICVYVAMCAECAKCCCRMSLCWCRSIVGRVVLLNIALPRSTVVFLPIYSDLLSE